RKHAKPYAARSQNHGSDWTTGFLVQFDLDLAVVRIQEPATSIHFLLVRFPFQLSRQPSEQEDGGRLVTRREIHGHAFHFRETMLGSWMIEKLRDGVTNLVEPGPVQIAKNNPLLGFLFCSFDQLHLLPEVFPTLTVETPCVDS